MIAVMIDLRSAHHDVGHSDRRETQSDGHKDLTEQFVPDRNKPHGQQGIRNGETDADDLQTEQDTEAALLVLHVLILALATAHVLSVGRPSRGPATVPIIFSEILEKRMCAEDQVMERRVRMNGEGHTAAAIPAYQDAYAWMLSRFGEGNVPVKDDCPEH